MKSSFSDFFVAAMGTSAAPFHYQEALANDSWPQIITIPTGLGKTAGIMMPWLWKRLNHDPDTPLRLIYCLPMRVLVEQTESCAQRWINNLLQESLLPESGKPSVHVMMGGNIQHDWHLNPEKDAIIIGTQDQLLSRALNRGYSMSRYMWPVHFGLLNNDCLWVMDEVQLMGTGLATTAQLQAFRNRFGTMLPAKSIWMSATQQRGWLDTIDFSEYLPSLRETGLTPEDQASALVVARLNARKSVRSLDVPSDNVRETAEAVVAAHRDGTLTLVVLNRVKRAAALYQALKRSRPSSDIVLLHSRFRGPDRRENLDRLLKRPASKGMICVATQVIEAGVDVSATTLVTDLAPWSSLVQRFGRCNRYGHDKDARILWIDVPSGSAEPYTPEELESARHIMVDLKDAGPQNLPTEMASRNHARVIRRRDIIDLFDTTPELGGMDIDISPFIRETEDRDVQVFWRDVPAHATPNPSEPDAHRDELCSVAVSELRKLKKVPLWSWDGMARRWARPDSVYPGMILMMRCSDGCYSKELGWTGKPKHVPTVLEAARQIAAAYDEDRDTSTEWQSLADHSESVVGEVRILIEALGIPFDWQTVLFIAARWHDAGKSHEIFQRAALGDPPEADPAVVWGKTARHGILYGRKGFRHELASALAMLENGLPDLPAYLAAAHHGKVRMSIRSMPHEQLPENQGIRFARGIWDDDLLPEANLGGGTLMPDTRMDLSFMELGEGPKGPSWLARTITLREQVGIFRLAFLESLLRIADWRGSMKTRGA